jgi:glycosyltransferase involved in cell wall biosynthesis
MDLKTYKICVDARLLTKSGIGRYISEIVPLLNNTYDLTCIISNEGIPFVNMHQINYLLSSAKIYSIKEQFELPRLIPTCDLFWSPHFNIPIFPIKSHKRLVTVHDAYHLAFSKSLNLQQRLYANFFFRMALKLSNSVITVSEFSKRELIKFTDAKL